MPFSGYDVIVLAGQSNAEGNGLGETSHPYEVNDRVLMMRDTSRIGFFENDENKLQFEATLPVKTEIVVADENEGTPEKRAIFALTFAEEYRKNVLADGRKVLIVHTAVGGTGFAQDLWGVGQPLFDRLCAMTKEALSTHKENRLVALLWDQGECDAYENPEFSPEQRTAYYEERLGALLDVFRKTFDCPDIPIIAGGFCDEWRLLYESQCDAIYKAYRLLLKKNPKMRFADTQGLASNNQKIGNGDDIHFCRESLYILGEKYFRLYQDVINQ